MAGRAKELERLQFTEMFMNPFLSHTLLHTRLISGSCSVTMCVEYEIQKALTLKQIDFVSHTGSHTCNVVHFQEETRACNECTYMAYQTYSNVCRHMNEILCQ